MLSIRVFEVGVILVGVFMKGLRHKDRFNCRKVSVLEFELTFRMSRLKSPSKVIVL